MKVIIVDDELQSHEVLKKLLIKDHPDIEVIASGYNVSEGLHLINAHQPDLVFLDIKMPDGTGFDLLKQCGQADFDVVFITAHHQYALNAIRFGALDFLLKPPRPNELNTALERVRLKKAERDKHGQWKLAYEAFHQFQQQQLPKRMIISTMEGIHYIPVDDIIRLEADKNTSEIYYVGAQKRLIASIHLGAYEEQFKPYRHFMRVHRRHLVNLLKVRGYVKSDGHLTMCDESKVRVSRINQEEVLRRMGEL